MRAIVLIGLILISGLLPAAEMYKWKDENGKWHYSDKPPKSDSKQVKKQTLDEVDTVGWTESPEVKKTKQKRKSGNYSSSRKKNKCNRSKNQSDYHDKRLKRGSSTNGSNYHKKKLRQERWKQLTNNC
ncbi:DUF4124 domain-containing protein [Pleionea litopenaei]|uniref:DUF4124 domain-containing protein n=1 Tax=Pleionea litopenaei TaxID=3070815 RepID=A0AA51X871_9GAMM|nr:DUF4124 domain-containing protein [Pleionea sp. HL-JVS1]WMS88644.1 DUF4124 domain-containing protein [Pleionea sp. HL-JVS1]